MTDIASAARANPLRLGPLDTRADLQRAVRDLYEPLVPYRSPREANVRLASFGSLFPERVCELEGYARPLYGIVPLTVGGGDFDHWDAFATGLDAGTDPASDEYWGAVESGPDQRMVEQAAIGLGLAFCPEQLWEPLSAAAKDRVTDWLHGIFRYDPAPNNWQYFRILVSLGLERVGRPVDADAVTRSLELLESYRRGDHWYVDGRTGNIDYYIPFAFHTYGLMYVAANRLGLGDDTVAGRYAERAGAFAHDFVPWFAPDGAAVPYGRSLTYRFAMASLWGALAWADVQGVDWGLAKGLSLRHLRWWATQPISDRDGVLSVGFAYDNRRMAEAYNSAGSPYWAMKYFGGLAAPSEHPFWSSAEQPLPALNGPITQPESGRVIDRDERQTVTLVGLPGLPVSFLDQARAKYDKFVYSSALGFSGDFDPAFGSAVTDSTLAFTDDGGHRKAKAGAVAAGVEDGMAWSTWFPWDDVRVDTVLWGGVPWHGRLHRVRTARALGVDEGGFAVPGNPMNLRGFRGPQRDRPEVAGSPRGTATIRDIGGDRATVIRPLPTNANLLDPRCEVPVLKGNIEAGDHILECVVFGDVGGAMPGDSPDTPAAARALLERIGEDEREPWPPIDDLLATLFASEPDDDA